VQDGGGHQAHASGREGLQRAAQAQPGGERAGQQADRDHQEVEGAGEQLGDHEDAGCNQPAHPVGHRWVSFRVV